ncbi:hypothetical protein ES705_25974 [subsurface metagenome]
MENVAEFFKKLLIEKREPKKVKKEDVEFKKGFKEIHYCFQSPDKAYEYMKFF